jgi:hypothetical protein
MRVFPRRPRAGLAPTCRAFDPSNPLHAINKAASKIDQNRIPPAKSGFDRRGSIECNAAARA